MHRIVFHTLVTFAQFLAFGTAVCTGVADFSPGLAFVRVAHVPTHVAARANVFAGAGRASIVTLETLYSCHSHSHSQS